MKIHQIWIGDTMPERIRTSVEGVRAKATSAGYDYHLWTEADIFGAFGGEPAALALERARATAAPATFAALVSDWARWRILADQGGLYLDTDNEVTVDVFPPPSAFGGADLMQHTRRDTRMETGAVAVNGERGRAAAAVVVELITARLFALGDMAEAVQRLRLTSIVAPQFVLTRCHPALRARGYTVEALPPSVASCTREDAALYHWGSWTWHDDRRPPAEVADSRPEWQRPRAAVVLRDKVVERSQRRMRAEQEASTPPAAPVARARFALPRRCARVVILSNVERGFLLPTLRDSDLVVSLNRCIHAAAARAAAPGAEHWAVVRSGSDLRWFAPAAFTGFSRVIFVDKTLGLSGMAWHRKYKAAAPDASPSTGFLVAATLRELFPTMPLLLVGFDPGTDHGTPLWSGHAWDYERTTYAAQGFTLLPPTD